MSAITSTILALGGLGVSAAQAIQANKQMNDAQKAAKKAADEARNIREQNAYNQLQVPMQAFDYANALAAQGNAQAISALQGVGAEGIIGGVGQLALANTDRGLQISAEAANKKLQVDAMRAEAQQGINQRKAERDYELDFNTNLGAQIARADAMNRRNSAIEGMFGFAGGALNYGNDVLNSDYYKNWQNNRANKANIDESIGFGIQALNELQPK